MPLERESTNPTKKCAVSIKKAGETVGHVPFNIAPVQVCQLSWRELVTKGWWKWRKTGSIEALATDLIARNPVHISFLWIYVLFILRATIVCKLHADGLVWKFNDQEARKSVRTVLIKLNLASPSLVEPRPLSGLWLRKAKASRKVRLNCTGGHHLRPGRATVIGVEGWPRNEFFCSILRAMQSGPR